ncbi:MAG: hypothetical protein QOG11_351 [Solirubrobacteraceae bacterium]|nr:hypothetical protein [Solirubrobacteraceae bacterium]
MRRATALLALLAAAVLAPAGPAAAKELTTLSVCGADGCVNRTERLADANRGHDGLLDVGTPMADPGAAPFVRLKLGIGDGRGRVFGRDVMVFVPRSGLVRAADGVWYRLPPAGLAFFRAAARGVARLPASRLPPPPAPPPAPPAEPTVAAPPAHHPAVAPARGDAGPSAGLIVGLAALALALAAGGSLAWRRHRARPHGRPAAG